SDVCSSDLTQLRQPSASSVQVWASALAQRVSPGAEQRSTPRQIACSPLSSQMAPLAAQSVTSTARQPLSCMTQACSSSSEQVRVPAPAQKSLQQPDTSKWQFSLQATSPAEKPIVAQVAPPSSAPSQSSPGSSTPLPEVA